MTAPQFDPRRTGPLAALRAWWWLTLILMIIGAVAGAAVAKSKVTQYTAESRLVVGADSLANYQVAGFAQASESLASNYARYVDNSSVVSGRLEHDLGRRTAALVGISASPIPGSDVISVQVVATNRVAAKAGAKSISNTLIDLTKPTDTGGGAAGLLRSYNKIAGEVQSQQSATTLLSDRVDRRRHPSSSLRKRLISAQTRLSLLQLQQTATGNQYTAAVTAAPTASNLNLIVRPAIISDNSSKTLQTYVVAGVIAGFLVGLGLASLLENRRRRRRSLRGASHQRRGRRRPAAEQRPAAPEPEPELPLTEPQEAFWRSQGSRV